VTSTVPESLKEAPVTASRCPDSVARKTPSEDRQTRTVRSTLHVATDSPSRLNATPVTWFV
jgi:hypothetical protein